MIKYNLIVYTYLDLLVVNSNTRILFYVYSHLTIAAMYLYLVNIEAFIYSTLLNCKVHFVN